MSTKKYDFSHTRSIDTTREKLWAKQHLSASDIDYSIWEKDKNILRQMSRFNRNCTFVVDVFKCRYAFASSNFVDMLGYDSHKITTIERQGDYLESRIHPDDLTRLKTLQVLLGKFIYSLPIEQRNNYCNIYGFRVRNAKQKYIRVVSKHQVLEQDRNGKAWLIVGYMDIDPDQKKFDQVDCTVFDLKNGEMFSPSALSTPSVHLTQRETEILRLIQKGSQSKEIANKLHISIHTVHIHRQNLLRKLGVQHSIEAINAGIELGLLH